MSNQEKFQAIHLFLKYTGLEDHEALKTSNIDLGQIDFDQIANNEVTQREYLLFEIVRYLATGQSTMLLQDISKLSHDDLTAFTYALLHLTKSMTIQENL